MKINNEFDLFQFVYLKTDPDQEQYIITSIRIEPGNVVMYLLKYCTESNWHFAEEISAEQDTVKKVK
jgi:hypothetical protein